MSAYKFSLAGFHRRVEKRVSEWARRQIIKRLFARDHTIWFKDKPPELTDRLGWLELPEISRRSLGDILEFGRYIKSGRFRHVVLIGMGGSSLAPEVFQKTLGNLSGYPRLFVADSTHPDAVRSLERSIDLQRTFFIVSSKSGTTIETACLYRYFWDRIGKMCSDPGGRFAAITDNGTELQAEARRKFSHVFVGQDDVGGRYSALSVFGLVPAAAIGVDVKRIIAGGLRAMNKLTDKSPAVRLGAALGELAALGVNKLTIVAPGCAASFAEWLEQLVAESSGKNSLGILPVVGEPWLGVNGYGADRLFVGILGGKGSEEARRRLTRLGKAGHPIIMIALPDKYAISQEFYNWEVATALACSVMGVNPFDQPHVKLAKEMTLKALKRPVAIEEGSNHRLIVKRFISNARSAAYVSIQAFLDPSTQVRRLLQEIRGSIGRSLGVVTTLGFGPRFLHSTGQLHKGGPSKGVFLQIVGGPGRDVRIPSERYSFGRLISAQALGDYKALKSLGRGVYRIFIGNDTVAGLRALRARIERDLEK